MMLLSNKTLVSLVVSSDPLMIDNTLSTSWLSLNAVISNTNNNKKKKKWGITPPAAEEGGAEASEDVLARIKEEKREEEVPSFVDPSNSKETMTLTSADGPKLDYATDSVFPLEAYRTQRQEPYTSYHCLPKRIHLSQANNVHLIPIPPHEQVYHNQTTEWALNMTLSFMLDYQKCNPYHKNKNNRTTHHKVVIHYRQGYHPEHTIEIVTSNNSSKTTIHNNNNNQPRQFNYTSPIVNGTGFFQSDWIYHVMLPNIKAGGHRYWYRIEVFHDDDDKNDDLKSEYVDDDDNDDRQSSNLDKTEDTHYHHSNNNNNDNEGDGDRRKRRLGGSRSSEVGPASSQPEIMKDRDTRVSSSSSSSSRFESSLLGKTPEYSFISPPFPRTPTSIALVGDLGQVRNESCSLLVLAGGCVCDAPPDC